MRQGLGRRKRPLLHRVDEAHLDVREGLADQPAGVHAHMAAARDDHTSRSAHVVAEKGEHFTELCGRRDHIGDVACLQHMLRSDDADLSVPLLADHGGVEPGKAPIHFAQWPCHRGRSGKAFDRKAKHLSAAEGSAFPDTRHGDETRDRLSDLDVG